MSAGRFASIMDTRVTEWVAVQIQTWEPSPIPPPGTPVAQNIYTIKLIQLRLQKCISQVQFKYEY